MKLTKTKVAIMTTLLICLALCAGAWWWLYLRNSPQNTQIPEIKHPTALANYYKNTGRPLVLLAQRLSEVPNNSSQEQCREFAKLKIDPLGSPEEIIEIIEQSPDQHAQDAAMSLVTSYRDYLAVCNTNKQKEAAKDVRFHSAINRKFMDTTQ